MILKLKKTIAKGWVLFCDTYNYYENKLAKVIADHTRPS